MAAEVLPAPSASPLQRHAKGFFWNLCGAAADDQPLGTCDVADLLTAFALADSLAAAHNAELPAATGPSAAATGATVGNDKDSVDAKAATPAPKALPTAMTGDDMAAELLRLAVAHTPARDTPRGRAFHRFVQRWRECDEFGGSRDARVEYESGTQLCARAVHAFLRVAGPPASAARAQCLNVFADLHRPANAAAAGADAAGDDDDQPTGDGDEAFGDRFAMALADQPAKPLPLPPLFMAVGNGSYVLAHALLAVAASDGLDVDVVAWRAISPGPYYGLHRQTLLHVLATDRRERGLVASLTDALLERIHTRTLNWGYGGGDGDETPLHSAVQWGNNQFVSLLLDSERGLALDFDLWATNSAGETPPAMSGNAELYCLAPHFTPAFDSSNARCDALSAAVPIALRSSDLPDPLLELVTRYLLWPKNK